jgi:ParB-like nuclease domain
LSKATTRKQKKRKGRKPRARAKARNWREALNALKGDATYEDLKSIERTARPAREVDQRRNVPIQELIVAEKVFQWRGEHSDLHAEERHMRELIRALELGRGLAPIVILKLGKKPYVVDGHHRLAAYASVGKTTVPAQFFNGSLEEAYLKSLDLNITDKLPIVRKDKWEAAFRLVKHRMRHADWLTWEGIAQRAVVSERLVYKMQATLRDNPEAFDWSWGKTLGQIRDQETEYRPGSDDFRDEHARKLADQIMSKVRINLTANPDITARALAMISEELPRALIEEWQGQAMEVFVQQARDANNEEAERALEEAFRHLAALPEL